MRGKKRQKTKTKINEQTKKKQNKKNEKQYRESYNTFPTRFRVLVNNTIYDIKNMNVLSL
jgi:hypothetical protein